MLLAPLKALILAQTRGLQSLSGSPCGNALACFTLGLIRSGCRQEEQPKPESRTHSMAESVKSAVIAGRGLIARLGEAAIDANDNEIRLRKSLLISPAADEPRRHSLAGDLRWMGLKLPTTIPLGFQILSALVGDLPAHPQFRFFRVAQLALFCSFPSSSVVDRQLREPRASRCWRSWRRSGRGLLRSARVDSLVFATWC